ncbi:helix-turn-helix transcriptional regulator [Streptomyces tsukubensis]|uniref:helix-turn-helix transcriptional regulator n=1 Tax=Streptomyces tsukubensis TaxID=83656 RepID=UPI00344E4341
MVRYGGTVHPGRVRDAAVRAAAAATDVDGFFDGVLGAMRPVLRSDLWAGVTLDPDTLMNTGGNFRHAVPRPYLARMLDIEYREGDVNGVAELARAPEPVGLLGSAVGGVRGRSPRYRDILYPLGLADELRVLLRDRYGVWGIMIIGLGPDAPPFGPEARAVARSLTEPLGEALRRLHLSRRAREAGPAAGAGGYAPDPALVLLDEEYGIVQLSPSAEFWLDELPALGERCPAGDGRPHGHCAGPDRRRTGAPGRWTERILPPAVYGIAAAVRSPGSSGSISSWAHTATLGRVRLHAWLMEGGGPARIAVSVEAAGPGEHLALITAAHGLTPREGEIVSLVLRGHPTAEIARLARLSPYTVQEHLKSVFDKTGVRSRRELVATLFARHVEPEVLRAADTGGPAASGAVPGRLEPRRAR